MVITKSISRFARNTLDCLNFVRLLKDLGIGVIFEKENISTLDSKGEVLLSILSSLAQDESYVAAAVRFMEERYGIPPMKGLEELSGDATANIQRKAKRGVKASTSTMGFCTKLL